MSTAWKGGSTTGWRRTRAFVLARDGYLCRAHTEGWCQRAQAKPHTCTVYAPPGGGPGIAGHAHHTHGRAKTGDDPRFIVASCPTCNLAIGEVVEHEDPPNKAVTRW